MLLPTPRLLAALQPFRRFPSEVHGPAHWARVHRFGRALADRIDLPDEARACVELFAWLHDLAREDDGPSPRHGVDGAAQVEAVLPAIAEGITPAQIHVVRTAIALHVDGLTAPRAAEAGAFDDAPWPRDLVVATVGCCWDADRLDLPRVGIWPSERYMSTPGWFHAHVELTWEPVARDRAALFAEIRRRGNPVILGILGRLGEDAIADPEVLLVAGAIDDPTLEPPPRPPPDDREPSP